MKTATLESPHILVVTPDVLGAKMAGPAIRSWEISHAVCDFAEVRLVSTQGATLNSTRFEVLEADDAQLHQHVDWADIVIFQGHILASHPWVAATDVILVADVYDPMHLEALEQGKELAPPDRSFFVTETTEVLNTQLERADFMLCASEKQRDFWLGQLAGVGRVNMITYDADPSLRSLIDVAPFGLSSSPPQRTRSAIKGVIPGIESDDHVILWGGGIYNWFDPCTLIHAIAEVVKTRPKVKLFFLGVTHPNPLVPRMREATAAMQLSDELGLTGKSVFFNDEWVAYEDRANYLLDADLGVSTHFDHVETALSFRTRILDYLWASLPIVATTGDTFAQIIDTHGLGRTVPPEDPAATAAAITELLYGNERAEVSARVEEFARTMTWDHALEPLVAFCRNPKHAADYPTLQPSMRRLEITHLKNVISQMESSSSWKLTRPLRKLVAMMRPTLSGK